MNTDLAKNIIKNSFNKAWKTYDDYCSIQNEICQDTIRFLLKYKSNFHAVGDFACGTGNSSRYLLNKIACKKFYGVDFSSNLLNIAKSKLPDKNFILSDFDDTNFTGQKLDLLFCNMGLQWSVNLKNTFRQFFNYLEKNGFFVFSLPVDNNFPQIKDGFKTEMPKHSEIVDFLSTSKFTLVEYACKTYTESFSSSIEILQSIKRIGANCSPYLKKENKFNLKRSQIDTIFTNSNETSLTYNIGIYIAKRDNNENYFYYRD